MTAPATPPPTPPADENAVKEKFKTWIGEVLDEREVKRAQAEKDKAEADAKAAADAKASNPINSLFSSLMGK